MTQNLMKQEIETFTKISKLLEPFSISRNTAQPSNMFKNVQIWRSMGKLNKKGN